MHTSLRLLFFQLILIAVIAVVASGQPAQPSAENPAGTSQPAVPAGSPPPPVSRPAQPDSTKVPENPSLVKPAENPELNGSSRRGHYVESLEKRAERRRDQQNASLPRFGESFFLRATEELTQSEEGQVPPDYVLRPGDQLHVITYNVKGGETAADLSIDQSGQIYLPGIGPSSLAGSTLSQARNSLDSQVRARSPNFRVKLSMSKVRKIRVFVLGEARHPGSLLVNPGSTVLDALLASRGPTDAGSYRRLELWRRRGGIETYDLYTLLLKGRTSSPRLEEGDRLFVPPSGPQVAIAGEVVRPAIYEVLKEKSLGEMLSLAGGLKPEADGSQLLIERMTGNTSRKLRDASISEVYQINLKNGDTVTVKPLLDDLTNAVYIEGAVRRPGAYSFYKGMRISQLLAKAQGMKEGAFPGRAEIYRRVSPELPVEILSFDLGAALKGKGNDLADPAVKSKDTVIVYEVSDNFVNTALVRIQGEIAKPGEYPRFKNMRLRDLVFQAGGVNPEASDIVELASRGPNGRLDRRQADLNSILTNPSSPENVMLADLDTVIIRRGLRARRWPATITVGGEVNKPGLYMIDPEKDNLEDVIEMAGGLTPKAYPKGSVFIRKKQELIDPAQETLSRNIFDLLQEIANKFAQAEENRNGTKAGTGGSAYSYAYSTTILPIFSKGAAEGGIREIDRIITSNRLPIPLSSILAHKSVDPGVRDGDSLFIPQEPRVVVVAGAVTRPSPILFEKNRTVDDYIGLSGGLTDDAAADKIFVIRVDGSMAKPGEETIIEQGDVIIAPPQAIIADADAFEAFVSLAQVTLNALFLGRVLKP